MSHSAALISTEELARRLGAPGLRVFDCTTYLRPRPEGGYNVESGRANYDKGHIPGAAFLDLPGELSEPDTRLRFTLPSLGELTKAFAAKGIGHGTFVVLYSHATPNWATRVWWMLRAVGFDRAAVLNGGWKKWTLEGRPISTDPCVYPPARFVTRPRPEIFVGKDAVLAGLGQRATCVINALSDEQHRGTGGVAYGRPGRIAGSGNVPARSLVDPATHAYLAPDALRRQFAASGALAAGRVITYCGGGIAASSDAFVLTLLGHDQVSVYDASLSEWASDPSLPMEKG